MPVLVLLGLTVIGFLVLLDRQDLRHFELEAAHRLEVAGLVGRLEQAHAEAARERATLLQRIQAPEAAVQEHATLVPVQMPEAISQDSDEDYWNAKTAEQEALDRIAQMETEGIR